MSLAPVLAAVSEDAEIVVAQNVFFGIIAAMIVTNTSRARPVA